MAAFVASSTTLTTNEIWSTVAPRRLKCVDVNLVLVAQGGLTNSIPASAFGLTTIEETLPARDSNSLVYVTGASYDRTKLCIYDVTNATDATRSTPADITATIRVTVKGKE